MQTLYLIRDYDRLKLEYTCLVDESPARDGQPRGNNISDPTGGVAVRMAETAERIKAVEASAALIPEEYRNYILSNVMYMNRLPYFADRSTWSRHRCKFIYYVAKNMKWI
jgi:hypothetical protein